MRICIYVLARFTFLIFFLVASIAAPIFNFLTYCLPPQLKDLTSLQCHSLPHSPAMEMSLTNLTTLPSPTPFQLLQSAITVSSNIQQPTSPPNPWSPSKSWNYETQPFWVSWTHHCACVCVLCFLFLSLPAFFCVGISSLRIFMQCATFNLNDASSPSIIPLKTLLCALWREKTSYNILTYKMRFTHRHSTIGWLRNFFLLKTQAHNRVFLVSKNNQP